MTTEEPWVGIEEVTKHMNVRRETIYRWIEKNGFPAHRAGRLLRFKISEIDEWVRNDDSSDLQNKTLGDKK
jgi:excisionase family DNA binding protein